MRDQDKIMKRVQINGIKIDFVTTYINRYFKTRLAHTTLLALAKAISERIDIKLDRLAKRYKSALMCWYAENWDIIQTQLKNYNIDMLMSDGSSSYQSSPSPQYSSADSIGSPCESPSSECPRMSIDPSDISTLLNYH